MNQVNTHVHMVYSPFREMMTSLHVLANPSHHLSRKDWAEKARSRFTSEMNGNFHLFTSTTNQWFNFLDLVDYLNIREKHVEEGIEQLTLLDDGKFLRFVLGERYDIPDEERTISEIQILEDVKSTKRKLRDFLYDYNSMVFARELYRIEPWLMKAIHELNEDYQVDPIIGLNTIHPRFEVTNEEFVFYKALTYRRQFDRVNSLTVYPSTFIAPHLLVSIDNPDLVVYLHVDLPGAENKAAEVPEDLLLTLKALGDPTRLKITRLLLYHSYCTQQLVDELDLAKATVSKHLKLLEKAGIIASKRKGHFVFYRTVPSKLNMLRVDLDEFFDQPLLDKEE